MIIVVPAVTPVTSPVVRPMVATPGLPLIQVPPVTASARVVVPPMHKGATPVIAGAVFTVTTIMEVHPAAS